MGSPYPLEKKNQILGRILSKEITVAQAHREYGIAESCLYHWLKAVKTSGAQPWDEGTKNGPDRSALLGHNFVYQETEPHGFYSSYFHQRISS